MSDEQTQEKKSRRAQRREAAERQGAPEAETEAAGEGAPEPETEADAAESAIVAPGAEASATETVREENRRARRAAAAKRRAKRERERDRAADIGLGAGEMVDDAVARGTDAAVRWVRRHFNVIQWVVVISVAGWIGWEIHTWRQAKAEAKSSDILASAMQSQQGKVGDPASAGDTDVRGYVDTRKVFASTDARLAAAKEAYAAAAEARPGEPIATLAELGLAGVLYDQGKYGEARKHYEEVLASALATEDPDVKGRALEGLALTNEAEGKIEPAMKRYKELENAEIEGFTDLARYQQARLLHEKGDDEQAKGLLKKVLEGKKPSPDQPPSYVTQSARDLLEQIDPTGAVDEAQNAVEQALQQLKVGDQPGAPAVPEGLGDKPTTPPAGSETP